MSKAIERRMVLRDQVTPTMSKINKSTLTHKKQIKNLKAEGNRTWNGLRRSMMGAAFAGLAVVKSIAAIRDMEEAYINQSQAVAKLEAVFRATGRATDDEIGSLKNYASELQKVGVIGDEVVLSGMQQIATFNVSADTVETLSKGMMDLVAQTKGLNATQGDAVNIANMVGKAMQGQVGSLSRVGITFTDAQAEVLKFGTEEEKAATMAQVLQQNVGGVNAALAMTDEGQIKQVSNAFGDLQEVVGGVVIKVKGAFAKAFNENLPAIEAKVHAVADAINRWVAEGGIDRFVNTLGIVKETLIQLAPVFGAVAAAITYYKVQAMYAAIAQQGLNAAMMSNPIGFVIGLLMALVGVIVIVKKNWETIKITFMKTWSTIAEWSESSINRMIGGLNRMLSAVVYFKDNVVHFFKSMWNLVVSEAEKSLQRWLAPLNAVLKAVGKETVKVDFGVAKADTTKPIYQKRNYIDEIEVKRFSDDTISAVEEARRKKQEKETEDNTAAMATLAQTLSENTDAVAENTSAVQSSSRDMTGEQIADKLLPRLERAVYG